MEPEYRHSRSNRNKDRTHRNRNHHEDNGSVDAVNPVTQHFGLHHSGRHGSDRSRQSREKNVVDQETPNLLGSESYSPGGRNHSSVEYSDDVDRIPDRYHRNNRGHSTRHHEQEPGYVNSNYSNRMAYPDGELSGYGEPEYDDDGGEFDENILQPEESLLSGSNVPRSSINRHSATRGHRNIPDESVPAVDSGSDVNGNSTAESTPRALGGSDQDFWNPELEAEDRRPSIPPQHVTNNAFHKFFASFRRFKKSKAKGSTPLAEQNTSDSRPEFHAKVIMLDGEEVSYELDRNETGHSLLIRVCQNADIVETDYFGLTYVSNKLRTWFWLDPEKKIHKQLHTGEPWLFSFQVKFYPPEPMLLQEDITRYQLTLQIRQDIYTGKLPCSWVTQALLGSFMVQAELGDYDEKEHGNSSGYLKEFEFVPSPTPQLVQKIWELHKTHIGMKPNQADVKYLETAKRLELYGIDLHPVRDTENVEIYLGVGFHGIVIYRDRLRIGRFAWPKVLRISYKKNNFFLKIRPDNAEPVETIIGFRLLNHHMANRLWKSAVEHHAFFRLKEAISPKGSLSALGSNGHYAGHTFFQYRTMNINRPHPQFDRSLTKRRTCSMPMGLNKSASLHTLNRPHPRDMTVRRIQEPEHHEQPRYETGSSMRHTGSVGQLYSTVPRASHTSAAPARGQYSRSSGEPNELNHRRRSTQDSRTLESQPHDYVNQRPAASSTGFVDSASYLSGSVTNDFREPSRRGEPRSDRRPSSPLYANVKQVNPNEPSNSSASDRYMGTSRPAGGRKSPGRKPPVGGVPVFGGVMLPGAQPSRRVDHPNSSHFQSSRHADSFEEEDDNDDFDAVDYDDREEEEDEDTNDQNYPPKATYGRQLVGTRNSRSSPVNNSRLSERHASGHSKPSSVHAPRRRVDNSELML